MYRERVLIDAAVNCQFCEALVKQKWIKFFNNSVHCEMFHYEKHQSCSITSLYNYSIRRFTEGKKNNGQK